MVKKTVPSSTQNNTEKFRYFRARLMAQLLVIFITITVGAFRIPFVFKTNSDWKKRSTILLITLPVLFALTLLVILKYLLYRRIGARILKYSDFIDFVFALVFATEWVVSLGSQWNALEKSEVQCYDIFLLMTFCSFSWRTLIQMLISQHWQIRIIAPTAAWIYVIQFGVKVKQDEAVYVAFWGTFQLLFVILIFYFEHKVNFTMTIGSIHQQQWLQLNEFILNNIPENIAIVDLAGNYKSINDNFKKLIRHYTQSTEISLFLRHIKEIEHQEEHNIASGDSESCIMEMNQLEPTASTPTNTLKRKFEPQDLQSLENLINAFGRGITESQVKEKSLYIFNSKFRQDNDDSTDERSFQINISFINQDPHKYILLILRDTTQRDLVLALQGDMKYKDQLLASVSHELRTPLNGNINLLEAAIRSKDISDKIKETLLVPAVKSSKFLLHLVNDILDLYQIKAQKLRLIFQQASLKETLINTLQLLELHAKKKGISLETDIDLNIPDSFCTDHARLSQIILNLMNNSIKFTQTGHVKLSAWFLTDTHNVNISIDDSGVGMTQEDIGKLFKDFTHIDRQDREKLNPTGVGLGLKIANDLAGLLGPTGNQGIQVNSTLNKGSTFSFVIENKKSGLESKRNLETLEAASPLVADEFNIATEASLEVKLARVTSIGSQNRLTAGIHSMATLSSSCLCPQVLVVDDDSFNIMAYEVILNSFGARYECVYNGKSAIDKMLNKVRYPCSLHCHPYKLVFMDEEMPGMTGRETVTEIRRLQKQGLLPRMEIIGCTAHHDKENIENFLKAGIVEYVSKPISFDTIKRILEKYDVHTII